MKPNNFRCFDPTRQCLCLLVWLMWSTMAFPLPAQEIAESASNASSNAAARKFYQQGISLFDAGEFTKAAAAFRAAYEKKATWKLHYNIGQAEAAAKRYGLALESFELYLVQGGDAVGEDRREEVTQEIRRIRVLVGVLKVNCDGGAELFIDDLKRGTAPFEGHIQ
ncbi:MAG: hypothetical protein JXR76_28700 [Deltaproteobacteria bacterium]|nr:hypothetical protein [Deltaproteobacteria bacterium]